MKDQGKVTKFQITQAPHSIIIQKLMGIDKAFYQKKVAKTF